ncbi:MAG: glycosyltransferase family 4 protein [Rhodovarius sp.]|nr:glycosyltransferase family 4 protein [Rhodovarius sp.]MCX7933427.1 glycosyltransferase family 4 protein [Rhodovarius sp.]MDW8315681.1 glycosyltransferase family 4 protein [Rhodovarius sp.]
MARRPLSILYLHQHFSTPAGSTATRSYAMARALVQRGHAVTIACGQYAGADVGLSGPFRAGRREGRVQGIRIVQFAIPCANAQGLRARSLAFLRFVARCLPLARGGGFDLIIASSTPLTVAIPALASGRPFLFEIRDPWPELPRALGGVPRPVLAAMDRLATAACRRAAAVIGLSEGMAETARARGAGRVEVIPNGCDLDLFGPHIPPWRPPEAASHEVLAVYAGAHGPANGLDLLLDAAALLRGLPLRILLVGEGREKPRLIARARAEGLSHVTFLDPMPKTDLARLFAGAQIGLHLLAPVPAFAELTSPNKLMDMLAAGLPIVSNVPGHAARCLADGPSGIAVTDAAGLAAALAALARDPARRAALGAAARAQAVRRWDRRLQARAFCDLVEEVAARAA